MRTLTNISLRHRLTLLIVSLLLIIVGLAAAIIWLVLPHPPKPALQTTNPVPDHIRRSVPFTIYYPDPAKLPTGYRLNTGSFSAGNQAVLYTISYGNGQRIVFTVQAKLSETDLRTFLTTRMPLRNDITTTIGPAAIGVINGRTVGSVAARTGGSWLLVTAPVDIKPADFEQVLKALTSSQQ